MKESIGIGQQKIKKVLIAERVFRSFSEFARLESSGGLVVIFATLVAMVWANSPWADSYISFWHTSISIGIGGTGLTHDLHWWINEALMVIFFFVIGLEIKREVLVGELSTLRKAALPVASAIGGMLFPALIYFLINTGGDGIQGWGIPMATDIAFALGVMALLGPRVPIGLKIFLTALAIVDDIGAILVIALFYSGQIALGYLGLGVLLLFALMIINLSGIRRPLPYIILGILLWLALLESGVHATLAGVLIAVTIPSGRVIHPQEYLKIARSYLHDFEHAGEKEHDQLSEQQQAALHGLDAATAKVETPLQRLEHALHPWVTFAIIPLFVLANAGITLGADIANFWSNRSSLGVFAGLIIGKQTGVVLAAWLAVKSRVADLPKNVSWKQIYGVGWLAGIGFTMSIFIASLALNDQAQVEYAKVGILFASVVAGLTSFLLLRRFSAST